jgi:hypothetical protein
MLLVVRACEAAQDATGCDCGVSTVPFKIEAFSEFGVQGQESDIADCSLEV